MVKLAANLSMMFTEYDFLDRFEAARRTGFKGVEYLFPYDYKPDQLVNLLAENGLSQVLHNLPAGDWDSGDRGIACDPARVGEFQDSVGVAVEYATALDCPQVNCLAGVKPDNVSGENARDTFISNLQFASPILESAGVKLIIESINTIDIPGFFLTHTDQAKEIIQDVNSKLHLDSHHILKFSLELSWYLQIQSNRALPSQCVPCNAHHCV